ncbi:MAG: hypothetical protein WBM13_15260 [Bacteroidia bacterium]
MKSIEEKIWDSITNSAKGKFDYVSFKENFSFDPDIIIFKIIMGFSVKTKKEILILQLHNELLLTGIVWDKKEIAKFVEDKENLFKIEIFASQVASNLLNEGNDPISVFNSISQLLN